METDNKYLYAKAYFKIRDLIINNPDQNVFVIRGGQGASKTVSILQLLIQALIADTKEVSVLSSELSKMKRTVIRDYTKICKDWGVQAVSNQFNRSENKHEYLNDSYIDFLGADVSDVGKGFRRDILYINEADKLDIETAVQFISRAKLTIIDYNPDTLFWGDDYINDNNLITLTFLDNEFLSKSEVDSILDYKKKGFFNPDLSYHDLFKESNIKNSYWANRWKVYGLGEVGNLDGVVFDNWKVIDSIPDEARLLGYGLDFGYTNDPTAIIEVYQYNDKRVLNEICYQTKLSNSEIAQYLDKNIVTYADSAEPKSIAEIARQGKYIKGVTKGADSISFGIQTMQGQNYLVTKKSVNLINELQKYTWDKDRNGNTLNKPIDKFNHCFVGETLITTIEGDKPIKDIEEGDLVLTRNGYKKVLKKFDNGIKKVIEQKIQLDTFSISLVGTKNHKVWTSKDWIELSKLKPQQKICVANNLKVKNIDYTQTKDILAGGEKDFIELYGNPTMGKYQMDTTYITSMETQQTTISKTSELSMVNYILDMKVKKGQHKIQNGLKTLIQKEGRHRKNGTLQKLGLIGIKSIGKIQSEISKKLKKNAIIAENPIKQNIQNVQSFVTTIVDLHQEEKGLDRVYDLMIEENHEYFANGILVHNCIDAVRYHEMESIGLKREWFVI